MSLFYRVLYTPQHREDWARGKRTSHHHGVPGEWQVNWVKTHSTSEDDYPLVLACGTYTASARSAFLELVPRLGVVTTWPVEYLKPVSELDGLCAFSSATGLRDWYNPNPYPPVFIEFEGEYVCPAPDGDQAVVARFISETRTWTSMAAFCADLRIPLKTDI